VHDLGCSNGVLEIFGGECWTLCCGVLTLGPLIDGRAYLGA
jgi:hypothetical protein